MAELTLVTIKEAISKLGLGKKKDLAWEIFDTITALGIPSNEITSVIANELRRRGEFPNCESNMDLQTCSQQFRKYAERYWQSVPLKIDPKEKKSSRRKGVGGSESQTSVSGNGEAKVIEPPKSGNQNIAKHIHSGGMKYYRGLPDADLVKLCRRNYAGFTKTEIQLGPKADNPMYEILKEKKLWQEIGITKKGDKVKGLAEKVAQTPASVQIPKAESPSENPVAEALARYKALGKTRVSRNFYEQFEKETLLNYLGTLKIGNETQLISHYRALHDTLAERDKVNLKKYFAERQKRTKEVELNPIPKAKRLYQRKIPAEVSTIVVPYHQQIADGVDRILQIRQERKYQGMDDDSLISAGLVIYAGLTLEQIKQRDPAYCTVVSQRGFSIEDIVEVGERIQKSLNQ